MVLEKKLPCFILARGGSKSLRKKNLHIFLNKPLIEHTINYAKKLNTTYAQFSVWTPYPGTPIFNSYKEKITTKKYEEFDQYRLVYNHEKFDKNEIRKYLSSAYKKYYLRFSWITKYIKSFY